MKTYTTRSGATQYKQTFERVERAAENNEGFCLACGKKQHGVEPDAKRYVCVKCKAEKVYGAEELAMMGFCY